MTRPKALFVITLLLAVSWPLGGWLRSRSRPPVDSASSPEAQKIAQVSYQVRVLLADALWNRLDTYLHEGVPIKMASGGWGVSFAGNLDILALLDWILILDPHFVTAYSILCQYHDNLGNTQRAVEIAEKGIAANPSNPELVELLGQLAVLQIRLDMPLEKPIANLEQALALSVKYHPAAQVFREDLLRGSLISLYHRAGRTSDAQRVASEGPSNLDPNHPAMQALESMGKGTSAKSPPAVMPHNDGDEDHDGHDHGGEGGGGGGHRITRFPRDEHRRPWREQERLKDIDHKIVIVGLLGIGLLLRFVLRRRRSTYL